MQRLHNWLIQRNDCPNLIWRHIDEDLWLANSPSNHLSRCCKWADFFHTTEIDDIIKVLRFNDFRCELWLKTMSYVNNGGEGIAFKCRMTSLALISVTHLLRISICWILKCTFNHSFICLKKLLQPLDFALYDVSLFSPIYLIELRKSP